MSPKRIFDFTVGLLGLTLLVPLLTVIAIAIRLESPGPSFFLQERVGRHGRRFYIVKLRTMRLARAHEKRQITIDGDPRITRLGHFLRKTKLDELPQLFNIVRGDMSLVGPRPEVPAYIACYTPEQQRVLLSVRPGITDFAAIEFSDEAELLAQAVDPEAAYINEVMPRKYVLYERYIVEQSMWLDLRLIFQTVIKIIHR